MSKFFQQIAKEIKKKNERSFLVNEENPYEVKNWVSTGCYALNAVLSDGDIFKGIPDGKRIMISGEPSTAKSLYTSFIIKSYLMQNKNAYAIFFETEGSSTVDMAKNVGIPEDRMIIIPIMTVEECRTQMVSIIDKIIDKKEGYVSSLTPKGELKRKKLTAKQIETQKEDGEDEKFIFIIDSLGMLSTKKETEDIASGKTTKDLTRAQLLRGFARVLSLKLSIAQCPLIVVNHVYSTFDQYNPLEVSGGSGGKYMADVILLLQKYKDKDGSNQIGVRIKTTVIKSRYMIENKFVNIMLHFKKGLYRFSHLVDMAYESDVFKKEGISFILPDGVKAKMKDVREKTSKFMNETNLKAIGEAIQEEFAFGKIDNTDIEFEDSDESIEDDIGEIDETDEDEEGNEEEIKFD